MKITDISDEAAQKIAKAILSTPLQSGQITQKQETCKYIGSAGYMYHVRKAGCREDKLIALDDDLDGFVFCPYCGRKIEIAR